MAFIKSIFFSALYYILFLLVLIGMNFLNITNNIGLYWIPSLISVFIISLIFFATLGIDDNRPRAALLFGFVLVIISAIADYLILVENFFEIDKLLADLPEQVIDVFRGMDKKSFYEDNLTYNVVRYILIFIAPFMFSLFIPKPDEDIKLPTTTKKG